MTAPASNTPSAIINDAAQDAGLIGSGDTLNSDQIASYWRRLQDLINLWQTQGLKLWLNEDITVPLVDGQAAYTFAPSGTVDMTKPLRVLQAYYLYTTTGVRRPLVVMSLNDYWTLGQAGTQAANRSTISQYLVEKLATQLKVTFWQCPDSTEASNGAVHLLMQVQVANAIELDETMNFPIEWRIALRWGLAAEICTGQPDAVIKRCESRAELYRTMLEDWDVEDAPTRFTPDPQYLVQGNSRFR